MPSTINQRQLFHELIGIRISLMRSDEYAERPRYESPIGGFGFGVPSRADLSKPGFLTTFLKQCVLLPVALLGIFVLCLFIPIVRAEFYFESRRVKKKILAEIRSFENHAEYSGALTEGGFSQFWSAYSFSDREASDPLKMKLMKEWLSHLIGRTAAEALKLEDQLENIRTSRGKTIMSGYEIGIVGVKFQCPYESITENISAGIPGVPMPRLHVKQKWR